MGLLSFIDSDAGKNILGKCYGFGASVVIVGALFKIEHFPFAGPMLCIGMGVEAILFALSGLEKPHKDYHWEKVFPHFDEEGHKFIEVSGSGFGGSKPLPDTQGIVLDDSQVKHLSESIKNLSNTASQLTTISQAAGVTDTYVQNIQAASDSAGIFAQSQQELAKSTSSIVQSYKQAEDEIGMVAEQSKVYATHVNTINKNLSSLNALYELQLKSTQTGIDELSTQVNAYKSMASDLEQLKTNTGIVVKESEEYKTQVAKLSRQVSDLNNVYGNMLNALNTKA
jgi:gliding motility-associated protein GldL